MMRNASKLLTVRTDLAVVVREVAEMFPVVVLCGRRDEAEQNAAFHRGASKLPWPKSPHNFSPSLAVDLAPDPIDWEDRDRFILLAGHVLVVAKKRGLKVRWGGDWNGNLVVRDERFQDLGHFEIQTEE